MKKISTLSMSFRLNSNRIIDGEPSIYCKITVDGNPTEISVQRTISKELWENGKLSGKSTKVKDLANYLAFFKTNAREHFTRLVESGKEVTAAALKCSILGIVPEGERKKSFTDMKKQMNKEFDDLVKKGDRSHKTLERLEISQNFFMEFLKQEKNLEDILLEKLNQSYAYDFEHFLSIKHNQSHNTYMKHIKNIKQVLIFSKKKCQLKDNPFDGFKCRYIDPEIVPLEQHEIDAIWNHPMPVERLQRVRDCFVFACYTGYAFTDLLNLQTGNIITSLDNEKWMIKDRTKTDVAERVLLLPIPLQIIEKYKNYPGKKEGYLFPTISLTNYNAFLKEIFAIAGIAKDPSSHDARYAFGTTVTLENDVPIESVQKMLGHKSIRTTQRYAKVTKRKLTNNMQALRTKLTVVSNQQPEQLTGS